MVYFWFPATTLTGFHFSVTALVGLVSNAAGYSASKHVPMWELLWFSIVANMSITGMNFSLMLNSVGFYQAHIINWFLTIFLLKIKSILALLLIWCRFQSWAWFLWFVWWNGFFMENTIQRKSRWLSQWLSSVWASVQCLTWMSMQKAFSVPVWQYCLHPFNKLWVSLKFGFSLLCNYKFIAKYAYMSWTTLHFNHYNKNGLPCSKKISNLDHWNASWFQLWQLTQQLK